MWCPIKVSGQSGRALPSLAGICLRRAPTNLNGSTAHPNSAPRPVGADTIVILGELGKIPTHCRTDATKDRSGRLAASEDE
jgi:hypothetical protein